ncbi:beta-lactamase/transpeptidase-like protein [Globomyces pollinis-pini]|nr:beta-lactamase/transpeptidase-like protein [Globomyces pollinis-pini]
MLPILYLALSVACLPQAHQSKPSNPNFDALVADLKKELPGWGVAGFTMGVIDLNNNQKQTWTAALGLKNASNPDDPVNVDTLFHIGSDSKLFTAFTVGNMVDQGKVNWKTPFKTYWPEFKLKDQFSESRANLIDLLSHRMGLSRVGDILMFQYDNTADMRSRFAKLEPSEEFRTSFKYNNHMYVYAGDLVGKLADPSTTNPTKSWFKNVNEVVFKPVGLQSAVASVDEFRKSKNIALAHVDSTTLYPEDINSSIDIVAPAGSIAMNIGDRLKWVEFLLNKGTTSNGKAILKPETFQQLFTPHNLFPYDPSAPVGAAGLASFITSYRGETYISHGGNVQGGVSVTCFFPDRKFGVVSLYTGQDFGKDNFCYDVADRLLFKDSKTLKHTFDAQKKQKEALANHKKSLVDAFNGRNKDTKPSFSIDQSFGEYVNPILGSAFLEKASAPNSTFQLNMKISIIPPFPFVHFENNKFVTPVEAGVDNSVEVRVEQNVIKGFTLRLQGMTDDVKDGIYYERV